MQRDLLVRARGKSWARLAHYFLSKIPQSLADRQWFAAASWFEGWLARLSWDPGHARRRRAYIQLEGIHKSIAGNPYGLGQEYPLFVMNRDVDTDRFAHFARRCDRLGITYTRVPCVDTMPPDFDFRPHANYIADTFWGSTSFNRGIVGNFLSHIRIWERIVEDRIPFAIVCEDDGLPVVTLPRSEAEFQLPTGFDLVFINLRAAAWLDSQALSLSSRAHPFCCVPFEEAVLSVMEQHARLVAPGAEGYAVSLAGAAALLQMARSARICSGDDWAMMVHSLSPRFREQLFKRLSPSQQREVAQLIIGEVQLKSYVLHPGLVDHRDKGKPTIVRLGPGSRVERSAMGF